MTSRRYKGEGSYSKDPRNGRVIYRNRTAGMTHKGRGDTRAQAKADWEEKARHILAGRPSGRPETFGEMLEAWLAEEVEPTRTRDQYRTYRAAARNWLVPSVGHVPAHELKPSQFRAAYRRPLDQGVGPDVVLGMRTVAIQAYTWAVGDGRIAGKDPGTLWNPAKAAKLPEEMPEKQSRPAPAIEDVELLLKVTDDMYNGALYRIMAECSMRPSEAAGLRRSDIDFGERLLWVRGALRHDKRLGESVWKEGTKTAQKQRRPGDDDRGERRIPFGPKLAALLHLQLLRVSEQRMASYWVSDIWASELVFRRPSDGRACDRQWVTGTMTKARRLAGVNIVSYQLRHYAPTRLREQGVPMAVVADLLGIDPRTARRYYADAPEVAIDRSILETIWT